MNLLERMRRFWRPDGTPDHPLSEREREQKPPAATDEESGYIVEGVFGETLGQDATDGPAMHE
ncbi:MAG TPA: hypothetical protein VMS63_07195 [Gaiellaceae bacterium]|jgi:hypothetical protein|nr:hypothetical protein [Gaiellaceae bacterium]